MNKVSPRKWLLLPLVIALLSTLLPRPALVAASAESRSAWVQAAARLEALGLIQGRPGPNGSTDLALDAPITRAELVTIIVRALGQAEAARSLKGQSTFPDVPAWHWASGEIAMAKRLVEQHGEALGSDVGFEPDRSVTHAEAVAFMAKFLGARPDAARAWPENYLLGATAAGILSPDDAQYVRPLQTAAAPRGMVFYLVDKGFAPSAGTATLAGPYEDPLQAEVPFGLHSYYLAPWRAYMDTWPATRFLSMVGVQFNNVPAQEADAVARVLAASGVRYGRIEAYPGQFDYDNPSRMEEGARSHFTAAMRAMQRHGIRPLILLNANSGWPVPIEPVTLNLLEPAGAGARTIRVNSTAAIKPGYTGFRGQDYHIGYPLITGCHSDGVCQLSAPLPQAVAAGPLTLYTLKYQPFAGAVFADGSPNPAAQETVQGWLTFVAAITREAKAVLGTEGAADAGFDLEVWNEYTFGSHFLSDEHYYNPPRQYRERLTYREGNVAVEGAEVILPLTVNWVRATENALPGVKVVSGFANQRPWESHDQLFTGQTGFSRHPYTWYKAEYPGADGNPGAQVNALGMVDRSGFVPAFTAAFPEHWLTAHQTEFLRDLLPFQSRNASHIGNFKHYRFSRRPGAPQGEVWFTETNFGRTAWVEQLEHQIGRSRHEPEFERMSHTIGAKALLRLLLMHNHKGLDRAYIYTAKDPYEGLELLPKSFFDSLNANGNRLNEATLAKVGPHMEMLGRLTALMSSGSPIANPRHLTVGKLVEHNPQVIFRGDGTAVHPNRYHRDNFAVLPYQLTDRKFAVGYYVVTTDVTKVWQPDKAPLDAARYIMPDQSFDITLENVQGGDLTVSVYDPLTGATLPATMLAKTQTSVTVRVPTTDYPRFLMLEEGAAGPLILTPTLIHQPDGSAVVTFETNVPTTATVSWGPMPSRSGLGQLTSAGGTRHRVTIPRLSTGEAIRITAAAGGVTAVWPKWDWDFRGAADSAKLAPPVSSGPSGALPGKLAGLQLWFDAAAITDVTDGQPVGLWADASGNGRHATQDEGARRPTYRAGAIGEQPALRFDGENDYLDLNGAFLENTPYTIAWVERVTAPKEHNWVLGGRSEAHNDNLHVGWHGGALALSQWGNDFEVPASPAKEGDLVVVVQNASQRAIRLNTKRIGTNSNSQLVLRNAELRIGWLEPIPNPVPGAFFRGDIAEIIIYNRALTDGEIGQLEQYLLQKYKSIAPAS